MEVYDSVQGGGSDYIFQTNNLELLWYTCIWTNMLHHHLNKKIRVVKLDDMLLLYDRSCQLVLTTLERSHPNKV